MKFLIIKHVDCEGPGYFARTLERSGIQTNTVNLHRGDSIDGSAGYDAVISMGGPMVISDRDDLSWMNPEIEFLAEQIEAGRPVLAVGLGCQLLATACGASVKPMLHHEFGILPVMLTDEGKEDPLFEGFSDVFTALHWHAQVASLPANATWLAMSERCSLQAFRKQNAWGIQFHLEVSPVMVTEWVNEYVDELATLEQRIPRPGAFLIDEVFRHEKTLETQGERLVSNFIRVVESL